MVYLFLKLSGEIIGKCHCHQFISIIFFRKTSLFVGNPNTDMRWGCKGISLYVVDGKHVTFKLIGPFQGFIGRIAFPVYGMKQLPKLF